MSKFSIIGKKIKGGGVGAYVKESIDFKRRTDIEKRYPSMEHLWIEIKGRNKHSNLLLGIVYRSDSVMVCSDWLGLFESLLSDLTVAWDGMLLVTGDINLDLFCPNKPPVRKYLDILSTLNLTQHVTKATRTTLHLETLIDHIITNMPRQVTFTDVLPCPHISDHDAPYVCINVRVTHCIPRYKYIRDERNLELDAFKQDFVQLPLKLGVFYGWAGNAIGPVKQTYPGVYRSPCSPPAYQGHAPARALDEISGYPAASAWISHLTEIGAQRQEWRYLEHVQGQTKWTQTQYQQNEKGFLQ